MNIKGLWLILLLVLSLNCLWAQEHYALRTFTTKDGLPHNQINSIAQDSTGFIWIATWDGLSRYDGYEFKNYYHNPDDSTSIPYFSVEKVLVDSHNKVFVACTAHPIVTYNRSGDNFEKVSSGKNLSPFGMTIDGKGEIWHFQASTGLNQWNNKKNRFDNIKLFDESGKDLTFFDNALVGVFCDNSDNLWIFQNLREQMRVVIGSWVDKKAEITFKSFWFPTPPDIQQMFDNAITLNIQPYITHTADTFLLTNTGLFRVITSTHILSKWTHPYLPGGFQGNQTLKWSNNNKDVQLYEPESGRLDSIRILQGQHVKDIMVDRQKNVWVSTLSGSGQGEGLVQAIPVAPFFRHYLTEENKPGSTNAFFAVLKDRMGNIWAAPRNLNFIFKIDSKNNIKKVNYIGNKIWKKEIHPRSLLEDSAGIWIGYYRNLLMYYDFSSGKFSVKYFEPLIETGSVLATGFENLIKTKNGLLGSSSNQIFTFDIKEKIMVSKKVFFEDKISSPLFKIILMPDSSVIACHNFGNVEIYDKNFLKKNTWKLGSGLFNVEDVCQGDHNDLWFALLGGGLAHLDMKTCKSEIFTTADGLSNNTCYSILKDRRGNLWISTNHGISRFNPNTRQFRKFDASDGLKIDEFNSDAAYQAPDGEMFFGGMGDIVSFYPDSLKENNIYQQPSHLVITDFKVSGLTRYFEKAVYDMDTVSLQKGDDNFQVTFACLDFRNSDKIKYRYRLYPEKETWTETDFRHRFVSFASLNPGEYRLDLEASNLEGGWVSKKTLMVIIPPFFYQTIVFRILILIVLILILSLLVYSYIRQIRLKARQQQEELRLESLRGQMNPHFVFNSLNSINYFIAKNDQLSANRYIADFSRLIRSFLSNLASEYIPLSKELESLDDYLKLEHLRFGDKFDYSVHLSEGISTSELMVFPGIVQPFVENAIWHGVRGLEGRKGIIRIEFNWSESHTLQCVVEDNGIGRKLAEARKSNLPGKTSRGISIVEERLRIINHLKKTNHQIVIEDLYPGKEETGTRVVIDIPVKTTV